MKRRLLALLFGLALHAQAETTRFAIIGDTPYSERERVELPKMIEHIADQGVDFIVHVGDFKGGQERCDDALFADRLEVFQHSRVPFVYVPGDNEWTDCNRLSNGGYDPQERLGQLRRIFFAEPRSLGQKHFAVERQSAEWPEHLRFRFGKTLFVTLNVPGSANNRGLGNKPNPEYLQRNPVVLQWMRDNFALARSENLQAIVLIFQADPDFAAFARGLPYRGYADFLDALQEESSHFSGQVVAVHGDTHFSRIDQPLADKQRHPLKNFTRVESFGYPIMGWTRAQIETGESARLRFSPNPWPPRP